jgi:hypothetical protein
MGLFIPGSAVEYATYTRQKEELSLTEGEADEIIANLVARQVYDIIAANWSPSHTEWVEFYEKQRVAAMGDDNEIVAEIYKNAVARVEEDENYYIDSIAGVGDWPEALIKKDVA